MGKLTIDDRIALADEATRLLSNKLFNQVIGAVIADTMNDMLAIPPGSDHLPVLHARLVGMEEFKKRLRLLENDGAVARKELERQRS